ncbi:MAG: AAA family ATPase [Acidobacteriota bacterium]
MRDAPSPDLQTLILADLEKRKKRPVGGPNRGIRCPACDDKSGSASFHVEKWAWNCKECGARGGYLEYCRHAEISIPSRGNGSNGSTYAPPPDDGPPDDGAPPPEYVGPPTAEASPQTGGKPKPPRLYKGLKGKKEVARYQYQPPDGPTRFKIRFEPGDNGKSKTFRWLIQSDTDGKLYWPSYEIPGNPNCLYDESQGLDGALHEGLEIHLTEGEKGAQALLALGLAATCAPETGWTAELSAQLEQADVVVHPDSDSSGREQAERATAELAKVAARVRVADPVELAKSSGIELQQKGAVDDWADRRQADGATGEEIAAELQAFVDGLAEWTDAEPDAEPDAPVDWNSIDPIPEPEFQLIEIEPREAVLELTPTSALKAGDLVAIVAQRGSGKTQIAQALAVGLGSGQPFFGYQVPRPVTVLRVDGEMLSDEIIERQLIYRPQVDANRLDSHLLSKRHIQATQKVTLPPLDEKEGQELVWAKVEKIGAKVLILDNVGSLTGIDENDQTSWHSFVEWLGWVRAQGVTVFVIHQLGKSPDRGSRGHSKFEDAPSAVAQLTAPKGHVSSEGCRFVLTWTKARNMHGVSPIECTLGPTPDGRQGSNGKPLVDWTVRPAKLSGEDLTNQIVAAHRNDPRATLRDLADRLKVSHSTISRNLDKAREMGLID